MGIWKTEPKLDEILTSNVHIAGHACFIDSVIKLFNRQNMLAFVKEVHDL